MANPNPYLSPDDDEDLLGDDTGKRKSDPNVVVEFRGPGGEQLPPDLQQALSEYFSDYHGTTKETIPMIYRAISGMYDYFYEITNYRQNGPLVAAVAEILDELTEGRVSMIYQLKEAQRKIHTIHSVKRQINLFLMGATNEEVSDVKTEMMMYFESLVSLCDFIQGRATSLYYDLCAKLEREPDTGLIESGYYTNRDTITRVSLGNPPARNDVE